MGNYYQYGNRNARPIEMTKYEQARNNSVKTRNNSIEDRSYRKDRKRYTAQQLKVAVVTTFLAGALLVGGVEYLKDQNAIFSACEQYYTIVSDNSHRAQDVKDYWINTRNIALDILNAEDRDLAIYAVYKNLEYNKHDNMVAIFSQMDKIIKGNSQSYPDIHEYGGYENYLRNMGCVDKDGNISFRKYKEKMDNYAASVGKLEKAKNNINR